MCVDSSPCQPSKLSGMQGNEMSPFDGQVSNDTHDMEAESSDSDVEIIGRDIHEAFMELPLTSPTSAAQPCMHGSSNARNYSL